MNHIIITGRLGRDPELKTAQNGTEYVKFSVAVDRRKKKGEDHPRTDWFECAAFGKQAVFINTYWKKGDGIEITGRMENEPYEQDGKKRASWGVVIEAVEFAKGSSNKKTDEATDGFTPVSDEQIPF